MGNAERCTLRAPTHQPRGNSLGITRVTFRYLPSTPPVRFLNYSQTTATFCSNTSRAPNIPASALASLSLPLLLSLRLTRSLSPSHSFSLAGANEASYYCRSAALRPVSMPRQSPAGRRVVVQALLNIPDQRNDFVPADVAGALQRSRESAVHRMEKLADTGAGFSRRRPASYRRPRNRGEWDTGDRRRSF